MYYVNPNGKGSIQFLGDMPANGPSGITSTEVMFDKGRILRVGGGAIRATQLKPGRNAAAVIDINGGTPTFTSVAPMPVGLHWATATVVADGRVVVTGGGPGNNQLSQRQFQRADLEPGDQSMDRGRADAADQQARSTLSFDRSPASRCHRSWSAAAEPAGP